MVLSQQSIHKKRGAVGREGTKFEKRQLRDDQVAREREPKHAFHRCL